LRFFFDADLDGLLDIFAANGHVADDIGTIQPKVTYAQRPHLSGTSARRDSKRSRPASVRPSSRRSSRAEPPGTISTNDARPDVAITTNSPARLLRNDRTATRLRVTLEGTAPNHAAPLAPAFGSKWKMDGNPGQW
jgi:hypothetical protein